MNFKDAKSAAISLLNTALFFFILGIAAKVMWTIFKFGWDALL